MSVLRKIVTILAFVFPLSVYAQEANELLHLYFSEVRAEKYPAIPKQFTLAENAKSVLGALSVYIQDSLNTVRAKAYTITQLTGNAARQSQVRSRAVDQLIQASKDNDSGNAGLAISYLTTFRKDDFGEASKDTLRNLIKRKSAHFDQLMKLAGFLELKDLQEDIRPYSQKGNVTNIRWAAIVSLARMGDPIASADMMRRVRKLPVGDDLIYKIFPDLIYSRHPDAIAYMVEVLHRQESECNTADAERPAAIPCGYRVMEQLAPVIQGYPLELDESGDVKTKDYEVALQTVREWFIKHKNYTILRDRF
ncbi:hypothetical protein [Chryseosolibacter indicus]|uniref:HEAT repeat domain-containing protein n=1 Tax=Chryseosolibacter indicus TaxID=2782351 RepID=A0ABS5VX14_9BACT|nr:hypothetical protein [Chryseosolibacter indicus]MBT1705419.1 hypothetical protein [Chryseosolibacter indicus]